MKGQQIINCKINLHFVCSILQSYFIFLTRHNEIYKIRFFAIYEGYIFKVKNNNVL